MDRKYVRDEYIIRENHKNENEQKMRKKSVCFD